MFLNETRGSSSSSSNLHIDESIITSPFGAEKAMENVSKQRKSNILAAPSPNNSFTFGGSTGKKKENISLRLGYGHRAENDRKTIFDEDSDDSDDLSANKSILDPFTKDDPIMKKKITIAGMKNNNLVGIHEAEENNKIQKREYELFKRRKELEDEEALLMEKKRKAAEDRMHDNGGNVVNFLKMTILKLEKTIAEKDKALAEKDAKLANVQKEMMKIQTNSQKIEADLLMRVQNLIDHNMKMQIELKNAAMKTEKMGMLQDPSLKERLGTRAKGSSDIRERLQSKAAGHNLEMGKPMFKRRLGKSLEGDGFNESTLDPEDILTEFGEHGPVPAKKMLKKM